MYPLNQIVATIPRVRPQGMSFKEVKELGLGGCEYCGENFGWYPTNCGYCGRWVCYSDIDRGWGCCPPCARYIDKWMNPPAPPPAGPGMPPMMGGPFPNPFGIP